ncbi:DUF3108 domain-containing protein [Aminobacter sp. UC22_36]|uniref:DUF3108 domain-containing protein n=1 Tax=Aminobacter sp. UC22_36 TaxID=3374549 RepID=UPI0037581B1F
MPRLSLALLIFALALSPSPLLAAKKSFSGDFSLSFLGIPVAKATFDSSYDGNSYVVNGKVSSAGLAAFFDDTRGTISSRGSFGDGRTRPRAFRADYVSGKVSSLVDIRFAGDRVSRTQVVPPPKKRGETWISARSRRSQRRRRSDRRHHHPRPQPRQGLRPHRQDL